jgi:uncharacterized membrane protein YdjX (TVP38/TMEM64 family)
VTTDPSTPRKKLPLLQLGAAAAVVGAVGYLVLRGLDYKALQVQSIALIRSLGPWTFFTAMAILPAFAAPLSLFTLTAGELYAPLLTMPGVIVAAFAAIAVNLALTYWLARYALRPLLARLIARYGYSIPSVTSENAVSVTLALRLTPGPPFFIQSYILGMAEVPFRMYMLLSILCQLPWGIGTIVLGKGIFNGNFKLVLYGVGVLVVATIVVQRLRKVYASRSAA